MHSDKDRFAGFQKAFKEFGAPLHEQLIVYGDGKLEGAAATARELLNRRERPTAVVCYNDMSALGTLRAAEEYGITVPHELSVTGFDDIFFAALARPALTTVRQPRREMGRKAAKLLLELFGGSPAEKTVVIHGELILRGSTTFPHYKCNV